MKSAPLSFDALSAAVGSFPDDGLTSSRQAALEQLRSVGMPSIREEDWKYTNIGAAIDVANDWLQAGAIHIGAGDQTDVAKSIDADWIVINNGQLEEDAIAVDGVEITRLSQSRNDITPAGRLGELNVALLRDGLHISIGSDVVLTRPLGFLIIDGVSTEPGASQIRVDIEANARSQASIIEYHTSAGSAGHFANSVINLTVGDGAHMDYVRIQDRDRRHTQTSHFGVSVGHDSRFRHCAFDFGGSLVRNDVAIDVVHPGSRSEFCGLYLAGDEQHIDNHTRIDHRRGPAESEQEYRGILTGTARGIWNGKAIVHEGADGTDAQQANHNLLLSGKAEIDAKPELEIYTDDVKCSHGTTVGQLDEAAMFYLRTRGLNSREAGQLLTRAFAQAIVNRSPLESLHEYLSDRIASRLDDLMQQENS